MVELRSHRCIPTAGMVVMACACLLAFSVAHAQTRKTAGDTPQSASGGRQIIACLHQAALRYGISANLLVAMARHESGLNPLAINRANFNGSVDVGLLQINSGWFSTLSKLGIAPQMLWEPCTNAMVGAWILAQNIQRHGYTWKAVGAYNAVTPHKQQAYAQRIHQALHSQHANDLATSKSLARSDQQQQSPPGAHPGQIAAAEFPAGQGVTHD